MTSAPSTSNDHAVLDAARDAHFGFVLSSLVTDARSQRDQLGEVASVQPEVGKLFLANGSGDLRSFGLNLAAFLVFDIHFGHGSGGFQGSGQREALSCAYLDPLHGQALETLCGEVQVVVSRRQASEIVNPAFIGQNRRLEAGATA